MDPRGIADLGQITWESETMEGLFRHVLAPSGTPVLSLQVSRSFAFARTVMALLSPGLTFSAVLFGAMIAPRSEDCFPGIADLLGAFYLNWPFPRYVRHSVLLDLGLRNRDSAFETTHRDSIRIETVFLRALDLRVSSANNQLSDVTRVFCRQLIDDTEIRWLRDPGGDPVPGSGRKEPIYRPPGPPRRPCAAESGLRR